MAFQCILMTPEQQLVNQTVTQAILPAHDGLMGVLTDRAPIITKLGIGPLRLDYLDGKKGYFFIDGGVAQMKLDTLTILTSSATAASEIDAVAASAEYTEAMARKAITPAEVEERDKDVQRARVKQSLSRK